MPKKIVSDKDSRFFPKLCQALICLLSCNLEISSGYHPQIDGQSEHFHYSVEQIFHSYVTASQSNWVVALTSAAFSLNSTVSLAHGKSLFAVLLRREPTLPLDLAMTKLSNCSVQAVSDFIRSYERIFCDIFMAIVKANDSIACSTDKYCCDVQFYSGDLVYVNTVHFPQLLGFLGSQILSGQDLFLLNK